MCFGNTASDFDEDGEDRCLVLRCGVVEVFELHEVKLLASVDVLAGLASTRHLVLAADLVITILSIRISYGVIEGYNSTSNLLLNPSIPHSLV